MRDQGEEFSHEMYEEMKRRASKKTVREEVNPEFERAFRELNLNKLFREFEARPMRSAPEDLMENVMKPVHLKNFSERDKRRMEFVKKHRFHRMSRRRIRD